METLGRSRRPEPQRNTAGAIVFAVAGIVLTLVGGAMTAAGTRRAPVAPSAQVLGLQVTRLSEHLAVAAPAKIGRLERGARTTIQIDIRNDAATTARVGDLSVRPADASARCRADLVAAAPEERAVVVPAGSTAAVQVQVTLAARASAECEAEAFPLTYTATVTAP